MDFKGICELIKTMSSSKITNLEVQEDGVYIKIGKEEGKIFLKESTEGTEKQKLEKSLELKEDNQDKEEPIDYKNEKICVVESPIVGTFYTAADPDKEPYVKVGSKVKKGDTLCIVEAMKLMNEIESEVDGEIVKMSSKNGDMVQYGEELFQIAVDK